jgi:hypothetical protein
MGKLIPEFCTRNLKESRYHLGTLAILGGYEANPKKQEVPIFETGSPIYPHHCAHVVGGIRGIAGLIGGSFNIRK